MLKSPLAGCQNCHVVKTSEYPEKYEMNGNEPIVSELTNGYKADIIDDSVGHHKRCHHHRKKLIFREKHFKPRASLLTLLMEKPDMRALRSFIISCFILMFIGSFLHDLTTYKNPLNHLWLVVWNFKQLPETLFVWALMAMSTLLPYSFLKMWSTTPCKEVTLRSELPLIALYAFYLFSLFCFPLVFLFKWQLNCACSFIITCENTRIAMKVHSFIRENVPRAIRIKLATKDDTKHESLDRFPSIAQLAYFLFCPSFIYRDQYPREVIILKQPPSLFLEFSSCVEIHTFFALLSVVDITICCYVWARVHIQMIYPRFNSVDYTKATISFMVDAIFASILPGLLCLLLLFYGLLHCWLNMFSEMLCFADRNFYVDWWNSRNMAEYYRNWNLVVHDWLYAYVYRDIAMVIGGKKGLKVAQTAVFLLSAAFHEYWFGTSLRFFYPVMFILYFIFGGIFYWVSLFIKSGQAWNIAMFSNLLIGTGMFVSFYSQEWYARHRCLPTSTNTYLDFIIPRHWFCSRCIDTIDIQNLVPSLRVGGLSDRGVLLWMDRPLIVPIPIIPQVLAAVLWSTALALGALLVSELFRLLTEIAKRKKQKQEQLPVLLADLDTLGQDTVYRQTVIGTTEDGTKDLKSQQEKNKKKKDNH